jgi:hypothetical protein
MTVIEMSFPDQYNSWRVEQHRSTTRENGGKALSGKIGITPQPWRVVTICCNALSILI